MINLPVNEKQCNEPITYYLEQTYKELVTPFRYVQMNSFPLSQQKRPPEHDSF